MSMTDLERAYALVHSDPERIEAALAAARREGTEAAAAQFHELEFVSLNELKEAERRGAEEMRERAKAACHERSQWAASKITNENADAMWATYSNACDDCLYFIAALPLTPEER